MSSRNLAGLALVTGNEKADSRTESREGQKSVLYPDTTKIKDCSD